MFLSHRARVSSLESTKFWGGETMILEGDMWAKIPDYKKPWRYVTFTTLNVATYVHELQVELYVSSLMHLSC